jgi:hypothetical protein
MNINNEILNSYLDGDLNPNEMDKVKKALESSSELKKEFDDLDRTHNILSKQKVCQTKNDFTNLVMQKISKKSKSENEQKIFLISILSILCIITVGIIGFILYQIVSAMPSTIDSTNTISSLSKNLNNFFSDLFSKNRLTLLGSILSFVMLISAYFLFELQKHSRKNLMI